ncbi:MAG TPA: phosphatidate cytidylyltransferase, partial [Acidimicrobiales bacterium]|nr:phosphatidate cytidylyltransferase [Acidimicrobiales bacterium]
EGLVGGMVTSVVVTLLVIGAVPGVHPWTTGDALALGLVVAMVAPIGDLCQSMVKRDLGIKDMGTLIPGHGGVMDRFDSLLFVLPATYYLVRLLDLA